MSSIESIGSGGAGAAASLVSSAENSTAVATELLKKSFHADKNLINTLLPLGRVYPGGVNIPA